MLLPEKHEDAILSCCLDSISSKQDCKVTLVRVDLFPYLAVVELMCLCRGLLWSELQTHNIILSLHSGHPSIGDFSFRHCHALVYSVPS